MIKYFITLTFSFLMIYSGVSNALVSSKDKLEIKKQISLKEDRLVTALKLIDNEEYIIGFKQLKQLATDGDRDAQFIIGTFYHTGLDDYINQDKQEAIIWYSLAAAEDVRSKGRHKDAQYLSLFNIGTIYNDLEAMDGIVQDKVKALEYFKKAAAKGHRNSQYNVGFFYFHGVEGILGRPGISENKKEAVKWWTMSAEEGCVKSQFMLGLTYYDLVPVDGIVQDYAKAAKWFDEAARQGDRSAQFLLGKMYFEGKGVPKNLLMSHQLLSFAADQGSERAKFWRDKVSEELIKHRVAGYSEREE